MIKNPVSTDAPLPTVMTVITVHFKYYFKSYYLCVVLESRDDTVKERLASARSGIESEEYVLFLFIYFCFVELN